MRSSNEAVCIFADLILSFLNPLEKRWELEGHRNLANPIREWLTLRHFDPKPMKILASEAAAIADEVSEEEPSLPGLTMPGFSATPKIIPWQTSYCMALCWVARLLAHQDETESRLAFIAKKATGAVLEAKAAFLSGKKPVNITD